MVDKITVFVSSVMNKDIEDIEVERNTVINAIKEYDATSPWAFEYHPASPLGAEEYYLNKVEECKLFCLVVGQKITRAVRTEYEKAEAENKRIFAFFKDIKRTEEVQELYNLIRDKHVTCDFCTTNQLFERVKDSFQDYINYLVEVANKQPKQISGFLTSYTPPNITPHKPPEVCIDRSREMSELQSSVLRKEGGVTGVCGMGGIGKSVLVSELWHNPEIRKAFPDGIITIICNVISYCG